MEVFSSKPFKSSSNISEIVSKFSKVCKLRTIGMFPSESNDALVEDSSDATTTEEAECDGLKVHPHPGELKTESNVFGHTEMMTLFDVVSALKSAYVQLQKAHIPYNPKMIAAADDLVMAELEVLFKIKHACKEKQFVKMRSDSSRLALLQAKSKVQERLLEELKSKVKAKNSEVIRLVEELKELDVGNAKFAEKIKQISLEREFDTFFNIRGFQKAFEAASKSIHDFGKPLISLMKASSWNLDLAAKFIEEEAVYSKRSHKKYAFEAYIARRMLSGTSLKECYSDYVMRFDDPIDALIEDPKSNFAKFCAEKYLLVVHPMMEASFFGNLDHRTFVSSGKHPRTPFYQIFARMAKWVWVLQGIAGSLNPKARAFTVNRGSDFSDVYMESVGEGNEGEVGLVQGQVKRRVEFMVMPGFKIGETLVKSKVYVSKIMESSNGKC